MNETPTPLAVAPLVARFAFGRFAAVAGNQIAFIALSWEIYERTRDPWALGLVGLVTLAPVLLLTLIAGNAADRFPRKRLGMAAHALAACAFAGLAWASYAGARIGILYALLFFVGAARAFSSPSTNTILPQLIGPERLARVNAYLASSFELAVIGGPALGGAIVAATKRPAIAYAVAAGAQLVFIAVLASMPSPPARATEKKGRSMRDVLGGFLFIRRTPVFLGAITLDLFAVLFGGAVALLPVFARDILHVGPAQLGWLRAAPSVGAVLMSLLATRLAPWKRPGVVLLGVVTGFGLATIGFGLSRSLVPALLCLFLTGVFDSVSVVIRQTLEQVMTPDELRGRVSAVHFVFIGFSNELGAFESGAAAAWLGPVAAVVGGGIASIAVVALVAVFCPQLTKIGPLATLRPVPPPHGSEPTSAAASAVQT